MRAAVIGGGVAGSASAIALARTGAEVTVYEAYEDPAGPVGSYVSLAVNGLRALDALGCLSRCSGPGSRSRASSCGPAAASCSATWRGAGAPTTPCTASR